MAFQDRQKIRFGALAVSSAMMLIYIIVLKGNDLTDTEKVRSTQVYSCFGKAVTPSTAQFTAPSGAAIDTVSGDCTLEDDEAKTVTVTLSGLPSGELYDDVTTTITDAKLKQIYPTCMVEINSLWGLGTNYNFLMTLIILATWCEYKRYKNVPDKLHNGVLPWILHVLVLIYGCFLLVKTPDMYEYGPCRKNNRYDVAVGFAVGLAMLAGPLFEVGEVLNGARSEKIALTTDRLDAFPLLTMKNVESVDALRSALLLWLALQSGLTIMLDEGTCDGKTFWILMLCFILAIAALLLAPQKEQEAGKSKYSTSFGIYCFLTLIVFIYGRLDDAENPINFSNSCAAEFHGIKASTMHDALDVLGYIMLVCACISVANTLIFRQGGEENRLKSGKATFFDTRVKAPSGMRPTDRLTKDEKDSLPGIQFV